MNNQDFINAQTEAFSRALRLMTQHALINEIEEAFLWTSHAVSAWKRLIYNARVEDVEKTALKLHKLASHTIEREAATIEQPAVNDANLLIHGLLSIF